jgi:hypothetical protein
MTEEVEAHVLKKYEILQKLGKIEVNLQEREPTVLYGRPLTRRPGRLLL